MGHPDDLTLSLVKNIKSMISNVYVISRLCVKRYHINSDGRKKKVFKYLDSSSSTQFVVSMVDPEQQFSFQFSFHCSSIYLLSGSN